MNWKKHVKEVIELTFLWGLGIFLVWGARNNGDAGMYFVGFLIGWGFYASYYLGKQNS